MIDHGLRIRKTRLDDVRQHPDNPRNGDIDLIAESLALNGQFKPIVVAADGTILAGNHTYQAALSLGWTHLATVTIDVDPHTPEARRIMLADNRTSDVGMYDETQLLTLLQGLEPNLTGTGYTDVDLSVLTRILEPVTTDDHTDEELADLVARAAWPTLTIREIPPDLWKQWLAVPGDSDMDRLVHLLGGQ